MLRRPGRLEVEEACLVRPGGVSQEATETLPESPDLSQVKQVTSVEQAPIVERVSRPTQRTRRRRRMERRADGEVDEFGVLKIQEGEYIAEDAFRDRPEIVCVKLPKTMLYIGKSAFENCVNLKEIVFPDELKLIGDRAFLGCASLSKIVIPGSVERVGQMAFYRCESLTSLEIRKGVRELGRLAFGACKSLENFHEWNLPRSVLRVVDAGRNRKDPVMMGAFGGSPCAVTRKEKKAQRAAKKFNEMFVQSMI